MTGTETTTEPLAHEPSTAPGVLTPDEQEHIREAAQETAASWPPMSDELAKLTRRLLRGGVT